MPLARRTLDRILRDEVRHRDFGWLLLDEMLDLPMARELRAIAQRELPRYFGGLRRAYGAGAKAHAPMDPETRAWGLMPLSEYNATLERALGRDWIPRFERRGIDAKSAWAKSLEETPAPTT